MKVTKKIVVVLLIISILITVTSPAFAEYVNNSIIEVSDTNEVTIYNKNNEEFETYPVEEDGTVYIDGQYKSLLSLETTQIKTFEASVPAPYAGFQAAYENEYGIIYVNIESTKENLAYFDKTTGKTWYVCPPNADSYEKNASTANISYIKSLLSLTYFNSSGQKSEYNSFDNAANLAAGQIAFNNIDNGVRVTSTIGRSSRVRLIPKAMLLTEFDELVEQLRADGRGNDADELGRRFMKISSDPESPYYIKENINEQEEYEARLPKLAESDMVIIRDVKQAYILEKVENIFVSLGWTYKKKAEYDVLDTKPDEISTTPLFVIPIEFTLEGNELVVDMKVNQIEYKKVFPIYQVEFMRFFGAGNLEDEGYIFVPDGSGALINFNNGKIKENTYLNKIYGIDRATDLEMRFESYDQITLPVYGIKNGDEAVLAIIEDGAALTEIKADISGKIFSYNTVWPQITALQNGEVDMESSTGTNVVKIYQPLIAQCSYKVRYCFLNDDEADYVGMANKYREYLLRNNKLNKTEYKENLTLYAQYVGSIDATHTIVGIPMLVREPLTTFEQARKITEALNSKNINDIDVQYIGWFNGGYRSRVPSALNVQRELGGAGGLSEFAEWLSSNGGSLYLDASFEYAYKDRIFDGFSSRTNSIRFMDKRTKLIYDTNIVTLYNTEDNMRYIVNPGSTVKYVDSFLNKIEGIKNISGVCFRTMALDVASDFNKNMPCDRDMTSDVYSEQIAKVADAGYKVMVNGGNDYSLSNADVILNLALSSNRFNICDESVPFYQIVVHGYVDYAGAPMNLSSNFRENMLRSMETGASLYVELIYEDNAKVKETDFNYLYSCNYETWLDDIGTEYERLNGVLSDVQDQTIIDHEKLANGVYMTTYEEGKRVVVNYNKVAYVTDEYTVAAQDYIVLK